MRSKTPNFELRKGEHVAIMGDNGAGKSTFVRQITGVEQPTSGQICFDGKEVNFKTGRSRRATAGIETVFQNLALADDLDVPSNLFLGREKVLFNLGPFCILDRKCMRKATEAALMRTGGENPQSVQQHPQHVGRPAPVRGDRQRPRPLPPSSSSWTSPRRRSACRRPRRSKTSSAR